MPSSDQEFWGWWEAEKEGSAEELSALYAWRESARRQRDHDVAVAAQHRLITSSLVNWFGACSCGVIPEGTLVDFETEEEWLEHLRREFEKEHS